MPRKILITLQCDWEGCDTEGPEGDGSVAERTVALDGKQAKAFLVCSKHSEALDEMLLPLMQKGTKVEQPSTKRAPKGAAASAASDGDQGEPDLVCREEGCERHGRPLKNTTGMAQHVIRAHGYTNLADYRESHAAA